MPEYIYRRDDGSTFMVRQKFSEDPLTVDPQTGQSVVRVVQPAGIIFKGSGFYVNDSKNASRSAVTSNGNGKSTESKTETSKDASPKSETPAAIAETTTPSSSVKSDAAD